MLHVGSSEALELFEHGEILVDDLHILLQLLRLEQQRFDLLFLGANFLAGVFFNRARSISGRENSNAIGTFGIERAVDRLRRQGRNDQLHLSRARRRLHFARDQRRILVDGHRGDFARGRCWLGGEDVADEETEDHKREGVR